MQPSKNFNDLVALMAKLRAECPWDKKQTNDSLLPFAIEETYELVEAIQSGDEIDIKGELGDVLLQVVFHACLYKEKNSFDIGDVIYTLMEKLIRRHPHVFAKDSVSVNGVIDDEAVIKKWNEIKAIEKAEERKRGRLPSKISDTKVGSALVQAQEVQKQASKVGFDWVDVTGAKEKLYEEIAELEKAIATEEQTAIIDELGDCFFALVNVARKLKVDSEVATLSTINKFKTRFSYIEAELAKENKTPQTATLAEMDELWEAAKKRSVLEEK